ncbi:MAG TPA: 16S rRNA (uracil(1498)-N(3))-methyltransferase [Blastocatellia bacterium]|nr:16S rRNA (uracil(1498)-N(3))-methyltransferase [Blastocatellia bacterium]
MQRHRFFAPPACHFDSRIILDPEESHHLARVLRLLPGATVFAFDGNGAEYECEITRVSKEATELNVIARLSNEVESSLHLILGQALIKGDKFDWVVQKATELGVTRIVPLVTEHSEFRKAEGRELRLQRWRRVALEAMKQSGRRKLLEVSEAQSFQQFCDAQTNGLRLIFSESGGRSLSETQRSNAVTLAIGPEGGWSEGELRLAKAHGFLPIHLGNRILRTETAAVAAVTLAQYLFGDLG